MRLHGFPPRAASPVRFLGLLLLFGSLALPATVWGNKGSSGAIPGPIRLVQHRLPTPLGDRNTWLLSASAEERADDQLQAQSGAAAAMREEKADPASRISPALAFLMSAALPGTGQLAEGRNRAFAYLGAEAFAWIAHFSWKDASNKKEGEYEAFADRHWNYDDWYATADACPQSIPPGQNLADLQETIRSQREANTDSYYASLCKQDGFRGGWDDFECTSTESFSPNRRHYCDMRQDSDDFLRNARLAATFAFLNRVVSAVDAYRTARGAQMSLSTSTRLELDIKGSVANPRAVLRIRRRL